MGINQGELLTREETMISETKPNQADKAVPINQARTKRNAGLWAGMVIFLFSLLFFILSFDYDYSSNVGPGPGFFPLYLSGILMILSIFYVFESVKGKNVSSEKWPKGEALKNVLSVLGCLVFFLLLFYLAGMIAASMVFLFLVFFKGYKWYINVAMSVGISLFLFWLFNNVLSVPLPVNGILF